MCAREKGVGFNPTPFLLRTKMNQENKNIDPLLASPSEARNEFDLTLTPKQMNEIVDFIRANLGKPAILTLGKLRKPLHTKLELIHVHHARIGWIVGVELK